MYFRGSVRNQLSIAKISVRRTPPSMEPWAHALPKSWLLGCWAVGLLPLGPKVCVPKMALPDSNGEFRFCPLWSVEGGGVGTRPWWLALLACGGAYWPLAGPMGLSVGGGGVQGSGGVTLLL